MKIIDLNYSHKQGVLGFWSYLKQGTAGSFLVHSVEELDFDEIFKLVMLFIDDVFK